MQQIYLAVIAMMGIAALFAVAGDLFVKILDARYKDDDKVQDMTPEEKRDIFCEPILPLDTK